MKQFTFPYKALFPLTKDDGYYKYYIGYKHDDQQRKKYLILQINLNQCNTTILISFFKGISNFAPQFTESFKTIFQKKKIHFEYPIQKVSLKYSPKVFDLSISEENLQIAFPDCQQINISQFKNNTNLSLQFILTVYLYYSSLFQLCHNSNLNQQQFDLSLQNIMEVANQVMILDFGLEILSNSKGRQPLHLAPEVLTNNYCPYVSESWSFGVLMLGILIGQQNLGPLKIMKNNRNQDLINTFIEQTCQRNCLNIQIILLLKDLLSISASTRIQWIKIEERLKNCFHQIKPSINYKVMNTNHHISTQRTVNQFQKVSIWNLDKAKNLFSCEENQSNNPNRKTESQQLSQKNYYLRHEIIQQQHQEENLREKNQTLNSLLSQQTHRRKIIQSLSQKHNKSLDKSRTVIDNQQNSLEKSSSHFNYALLAVRTNIQRKNNQFVTKKKINDSSCEINRNKSAEEFSIQQQQYQYNYNYKLNSQQKSINFNESSIQQETITSKQYEYTETKGNFDDIIDHTNNTNDFTCSDNKIFKPQEEFVNQDFKLSTPPQKSQINSFQINDARLGYNLLNTKYTSVANNKNNQHQILLKPSQQSRPLSSKNTDFLLDKNVIGIEIQEIQEINYGNSLQEKSNLNVMPLEQQNSSARYIESSPSIQRVNEIEGTVKFKKPDRQPSQQSNRKVQEALETIILEDESNLSYFKQPEYLGIEEEKKEIKVEDHSEEFNLVLNKLEEIYKYINIIGETVGKCVEYLDAYENVWIIPLSIIFKRMYQMRHNFFNEIIEGKGGFEIPHQKEFVKWEKFMQFSKKIVSENQTVRAEAEEIINISLEKIDKLDQEGRAKISSFLNLDLNCDIKDIVFVYLHSQILARIKQIIKNVKKVKQDKSAKKKKQHIMNFTEIQWMQLELLIQFSLIILENYPFQKQIFEQTQNHLQNYQDLIEDDVNFDVLQKKIQENEVIIQEFQKRLVDQGYQV